MINISVIIITNNSADIIKNTVEALYWCDEIITIDSGSSDNTIKICEELGCKTFSRKFNGYGEQKNYGATLAKNDWILSVDADEVVSEKLQAEIIEVFNSEKIEYCGFYLPITLVFCGRVFKYCENSKPHLRLFNKKFASWNDSEVHEKVVCKGKTKILKNEVLHYSFRDISHYIQKMDVYTTRGAEELFKRNKKISLLLIFLRFPFDFFKFYLIRGCFLEGFPGFIWAMMSSYYPVVKYFKLYELRKSKTR